MGNKISVIVPIYNVERYLERCLDSLISQTYENLEIILVNDGSTDGSSAIIQHYVKQFPRTFKAYSKPNGGLSDARNFGIEKASGDYIGFIDSDDYVEPTLYQDLYESIVKSNSLLSLCDIEYVFEDHRSSYILNGLNENADLSIQQSLFLSPLFAWNKLYHRSIFDSFGFRYPKELWYEDIPVTVPLIGKLNNVGYVKKPLIHYVQRTTSIMGTRNSSKLSDIFTVLLMVKDYYLVNNIFDTFINEIEYLFIEHLLVYGAFRFFRSNESKTLVKYALEIMKDSFPKWKKNPYLNQFNLPTRIYLSLLNSFTWRIFKYLVLLKGQFI